MDVSSLISTGGDLSTIGLLLLFWRFDRRLFVIEQKVFAQ